MPPLDTKVLELLLQASTVQAETAAAVKEHESIINERGETLAQLETKIDEVSDRVDNVAQNMVTSERLAEMIAFEVHRQREPWWVGALRTTVGTVAATTILALFGYLVGHVHLSFH